MTFYKVTEAHDGAFSAKIWIDTRLDPSDDTPFESESDTTAWLLITPAITVGDILQDAFPTFPDFELLVSTPNKSIFTQPIDWSGPFDSFAEFKEYVRDRLVWLTSTLARLESGTFFQ